MKTSLGLIDKLFGKKITLELPKSDGSKRKVIVSKKWFDKMKSEGKIQEAGFVVTMHMMGIHKYEKEKWIVGQDINEETYLKFKDSSGDIYGIRYYKDGKLEIGLSSKEKWLEARKEIGY